MSIAVEYQIGCDIGGTFTEIVPRELVVEVSERIDKKGSKVVPLTENEARRAVTELVDKGVEAIAISLLWGFLEPAHEELLASIVEKEHPEIFLSVASRLHPVIWERTAHGGHSLGRRRDGPPPRQRTVPPGQRDPP